MLSRLSAQTNLSTTSVPNFINTYTKVARAERDPNRPTMSSPPPFILSKPELERALYAENQSISSGRLKDENPLDTSPLFHTFCESCRRGDLKATQEMLSAGKVDVNGRDEFDYTPLILVCNSRSADQRTGADVLKRHRHLFVGTSRR